MNFGEEVFHNLVKINQEEQVEKPKKPTLKERKAARRARLLIGKNVGRWTLDQRREYYVFLKIYSEFFANKEHRRNDKVYRMMANFVKSRTPDQCRTHHQKLQAKYHRSSKILQALKDEFGSIQFQEIVRKCDTTTTVAGTPIQGIKNLEPFSQKNNNRFQLSGNEIIVPNVDFDLLFQNVSQGPLLTDCLPMFLDGYLS